jgi:hypothetical protein
LIQSHTIDIDYAVEPELYQKRTPKAKDMPHDHCTDPRHYRAAHPS